MKKPLIITLLLSLALLAGLPWLAGFQIEPYYQDLLAGMERQGARVDANHYRRGWFSSTARAELALAAAGEGTPVRLVLESRILHGPLIWEDLPRGRFHPLQAKIRTRVLLDGGDGWFAAEDPPTLVTRVALDGSGESRLRFPDLDRHLNGGNGRLRLQGAGARLRFGDGFGWIKGQGHLPTLELSRNGRTLIALAGVASDSELSGGPAGFMLGQGRFSIGSLRVLNPESGGVLELGGGEVSAHSSAVGELLHLRVSYRAQRLRLDGADYAPSELVISLDRLSAPVLTELNERLRELTGSAVAEAQRGLALTAILASRLERLLQSGPRLTVERLRVTTPDGVIAGRIDIRAGAVNAQTPSSSSRWVNRLQGEARLSLPEPLLRRLLAARLRERITQAAGRVADPEALESRVQAAVDRQLETLLRQELVVRDRGRIATLARLNAGLLTINGKTVPLGL